MAQPGRPCAVLCPWPPLPSAARSARADLGRPRGGRAPRPRVDLVHRAPPLCAADVRGPRVGAGLPLMTSAASFFLCKNI
uniref:Uncharacterized protein n=1 Tax=Oryza sativa subsp. japonica TaxID=39947 RepID=Q5VMH6_ORYSJ|nr:hypothetical protein [Oryza sativa Japonica Group]